MLFDLKESESQELKELEKMKLFDKIEKIRQEKDFTRYTEKIDGQSDWEQSRQKIKNLQNYKVLLPQGKIKNQAQVRLQCHNL